MAMTVDAETGEVTEGREATNDLLQKEFPQRAIKQRAGGGGKVFSYVSTDTVIRRLNEATDNNWSFAILKYEFLPATNRDGQDEQIMLVQGELTIPGFGSRQGFGVQRFPKPIVNTDDLLKAASGDALKRAAVSFGVAIDLYGSDLENGDLPDNVRTMSQNAPQAPVRGARTPQAQSPQPTRNAAPVPSQRALGVPATYPKVPGITDTASVLDYMQRNGINVTGSKLGDAIKGANEYGKEVHGIDTIVVPTGDVDPAKPQYGPRTWPSDVANALGYWFQKEESQGEDVPAAKVGGLLPGEEGGEEFDESVPF